MKNTIVAKEVQVIAREALISLFISHIYAALLDCLIRQYCHPQSHQMFDVKELCIFAPTCSSETRDEYVKHMPLQIFFNYYFPITASVMK